MCTVCVIACMQDLVAASYSGGRLFLGKTLVLLISLSPSLHVQAFQVLSFSNATDDRYPLVIVARQEGAVVSWTVPFKPQG